VPVPTSRTLVRLFTPIFQPSSWAGHLHGLVGDMGGDHHRDHPHPGLVGPDVPAADRSQRRCRRCSPSEGAAGEVQGRQAEAPAGADAFTRARRQPLSGCQPSIVQMFLLLPKYSVFSCGLSAPDISSMLNVFGFHLDVACRRGGQRPCALHRRPRLVGGLDAKVAGLSSFQGLPVIGGFGARACLGCAQLVQTMMMLNTSDPQTRAQNRAFSSCPSLRDLRRIPAVRLFIYWITTTSSHRSNI
jgi:hypothetical protein